MRRTLPPAQSFIVSKEEDFVLDDRAAARNPELIQGEVRPSS